MNPHHSFLHFVPSVPNKRRRIKKGYKREAGKSRVRALFFLASANTTRSFLAVFLAGCVVVNAPMLVFGLTSPQELRYRGALQRSATRLFLKNTGTAGTDCTWVMLKCFHCIDLAASCLHLCSKNAGSDISQLARLMFQQ